MKAKYNRISSIEQNLARQEKNAHEFGKVYSDRVSGIVSFFQRKEASKLVEDIKSGLVSEVHVTNVDRLGRDILDILNVIEFFYKHGVNLYVESISMYSMENNKPNQTFKMIVLVLGNVAEMERNIMLDRQRHGIEIAKAKGTYRGRLYGTHMSNDEILTKYKKVVKELKTGSSLRRSALIGNCSLGTAQKVQRLLLNENK